MQCGGTDLRAELADLADDVALLFPDTAQVYRYSASTKDTYGGRTETWTLDTATIKVDIRDFKPPQPTQVGMRLEDQNDSFSIRTVTTVFLNAKDRLVVNAVKYEVQGEMERDSLALFHTYWCQIVRDIP